MLHRGIYYQSEILFEKGGLTLTYTRARVNYCAHLGKNVVFACINEEENNWECMNKQDCNFEALGCRNKLVVKTDEIKKQQSFQ